MTHSTYPKPDNQINITIIGAGSNGQTLAYLYTSPERKNGNGLKYKVTLVDRSFERMGYLWFMQNHKMNFDYLKQNNETKNQIHYDFGKVETNSDNVFIVDPLEFGNLEDRIGIALKDNPFGKQDIVIFSVSQDGLREAAKLTKPYIERGTYVVIHTKGAEIDVHENEASVRNAYRIVKEELEGAGVPKYIQYGFTMYTKLLDGKFAHTALATGGDKQHKHHSDIPKSELTKKLAYMLARENYKVDSTKFLNSLQAEAMLKPIAAMIAGIFSSYEHNGKQVYNSNTAIGPMIGAFMNSTFPLAVELGANAVLYMHPSITSDMWGTALDPDSRNFRAGFARGEGKNIEEIKAEVGQTIEGLTLLPKLNELIKINPRLDIARFIPELNNIFFNNANIGDTIKEILGKESLGIHQQLTSYTKSMIKAARNDRHGESEVFVIK